MPNTPSAIKSLKQNEKRRLRNRATRSELRTRVKIAVAAPTGDDTDGSARGEALRLAVQRIDKAAAKGVIHPNAAARKKSRLTRLVAGGTSPESA